jgi:hypothetical protein
MIPITQQARRFRGLCGLLFPFVTIAFAPGAGAQQKPSYQVVAPDIVPQGEEFTIRVVVNTDAGQVPIAKGNEVGINGTVVPAEEGGRVRVPPFVKETGSQFLRVTVRTPADGPGGTEVTAPVPPHIEVVRLLQPPGQLPSTLWRVSDLAPPGNNIRVDGQALGGLLNAALQGNGITIPLRDFVGSSLQHIYRCPNDLPKGKYHFVAQDASGHTLEAPNTTTNPTLSITGTQIRQRGQRGSFVISSDVEGDVQLSGGEPEIRLDIRNVHVSPTSPGTVNFTALQVGSYDVQAFMLNLDWPLVNAPRAEANVGKPQAHFNPGEGKTAVKAPIRITGEGGQPVANSAVDVALVGPQGMQYARVITNKDGEASFLASVPGQVAAEALTLHCFRVLGHLWNTPEKPK